MIRSGIKGRTIITLSVALTVGLMLLTLSLGLSKTAAQATLFSDNFEDGAADGWTIAGGTWTVATDGTRVFQQSNRSSRYRAAAGASSWTNYTVQARVKPLSFNGTDRAVSLLARYVDNNNHYALSLRNSGRLRLSKVRGGTSTTLAEIAFPAGVGTWYTLDLEVVGTTLRGYVNGTLLLSATDSTFPAGRIGAGMDYASGAYDNFVVKAGSAPPPPPPPTPTPTPGPPPPPLPPSPGPIGFASVNALGQNGTTGGAGGPAVTVTNASEFADYASRTGPYIIRVSGMIALPAMTNVSSHKSIIGIGSNSGFTGFGLTLGPPADDSVTTPPADAVRNVIIRNLVFTNSGDDAINIQMFTHHVWIDHNDLSNCFDGLIDIKRGSNYITVSWNYTHNHTKNMLLGHSDSNSAQDTGFLKVTYHHNRYQDTPQRNPRARFGEPVHIFNNYYFHNADTGAACSIGSGCVVEGNYFESVDEPFTNSYHGTGKVVARNNFFVDSGPGRTGGSVQEPSTYYRYTVDNPADIKSIVIAGAGVGKLGF